MIRYMRLAVMVLGMQLTIGCSDDSAGGGSGNSIQKCDTMLDAVCGYYSRCEEVAQTQTYNSAYNQCLSALQEQNKSCSDAIGTKDTYDVCLSEVKAGTCPFKLPSDCQHVISASSSGSGGNTSSGGSAGTSSGNAGTNSGGHAGTNSGGHAGTSSGSAGTSGGGGTSASNDAIEKCQEYSSTLCHAAEGCSNNGNLTYDQCLQTLKSEGVDCSQIKSVTSGFNGCISALKASKCPDALPSECKGVLLK